MADIPTKEPSVINIGDTLEWNINDLSADYPASLWTLAYYLQGPKPITINASANGDDFSIVVAAAVTATWTAGDYAWVAKVTEIATSRVFTVRDGKVSLIADASTVTGATDSRSHVKRTLDNIEAVIEGRATKDQESYSIANRSLARTPIEDLLKLRAEYSAAYKEEQAEDAVNVGEDSGRTMRTTFKPQ